MLEETAKHITGRCRQSLLRDQFLYPVRPIEPGCSSADFGFGGKSPLTRYSGEKTLHEKTTGLRNRWSRVDGAMTPYSVTNRAKKPRVSLWLILRYAAASSSNNSRTRGTFLSVLACSNLSRHDCKLKSIFGRDAEPILPKLGFP